MTAAYIIIALALALLLLTLIAVRLGRAQEQTSAAEAGAQVTREVMHDVQVVEMHSADASLDELRAKANQQRLSLGAADQADGGGH